MPRAEVDIAPLADGGEGTCALLTRWHHGRPVAVQVQGPLFEPVTARYGLSEDGKAAFIEMAEASGLTLLKPDQQNPLYTTSLGTGELIADALERGADRIVLGIGGSATNDAGTGMASALGYSFHDRSGEPLQPIGGNLIHLHSIRSDNLHPRLRVVSVTALCDVSNPLDGPEGAAHIYGPQKGASAADVELLDAGLRNFRTVVKASLGKSVDFPGAGAAGGLGAGARVFLNANIQRGVDYMVQQSGLAEKIKWADLVITGEGKVDHQTFSGKVVSEVIRLSAKASKPVYVICGVCGVSTEQLRAFGITKVLPLVDGTTSPESAVQSARFYIHRKIYEAFRDPDLI